MKTVKFDKNHSKDFITELRKAVEEYFKKNNQTRFGNANMVFKSIFMLLLYFVPYTVAISGVITNNWLYWLLWVCMGVGMAGIGLSIMHDANHGSYSKNKLIKQSLYKRNNPGVFSKSDCCLTFVLNISDLLCDCFRMI